jgi:hypothetical protein
MASTGATGLDVITPGATVAVPSTPGGKGPIVAAWPGSTPAGFGNGWNSGDEEGEASGVTGEHRGRRLGPSAVGSEEGSGVIFGGNRRIDGTGGREGRTIRTVSVFGSAMGGWGYD